MEDFLIMMGWQYLCLDGGTKMEERATHVQLFNTKDSETKSSFYPHVWVVWV